MNIDAYLAILQRELPTLNIEQIDINQQGWDHEVAVVNRSIVLRIPKQQAIEEKVEMEKRLLDALSLQQPKLCIPQYRLLKDEASGRKCAYYPFLEGQPISETADLAAIQTEENALVLADFLSKLHRMEPAPFQEAGLACVYTKEYWDRFLQSIKHELFEYLTAEEQQDVISFFQSVHSFHCERYCVIHGDLTGANILIDRCNHRICAVIDFSDAQLYDPAFDFAGLYWTFGADFTKKVLQYYEKTEEAVDIYERVRMFFGIQPIFHELLYRKRNNMALPIDTYMEKYKEMRKMANMNKGALSWNAEERGTPT